MGKDIVLSQFDDIEEKVETLLVLCSSLKDENSELNKRIIELEEAEKLNGEQRELVKDKVDSLLSKLKNFTEITS